MPARTLAIALACMVSLAGLLWPVPPQTTAVDAAGAGYRLPWEGGRRLFTLQAQQQGSHTGPSQQYAYDFSLGPFDGSPFTVVAARAGTVRAVRQSSDPSPDCDLRYYQLANLVLLDHGDGTGAMYSHLLKGSALVVVGQKVAQGQPLARSDHSGYWCGTGHLHFTVLDLSTWASLDRPFADVDAQRDGGRPRTGQWYTADSGLPRTAQTMAPRVFLPFLGRLHRGYPPLHEGEPRGFFPAPPRAGAGGRTTARNRRRRQRCAPAAAPSPPPSARSRRPALRPAAAGGG
ncbi:MAG: M23 family metallopeptidase [Chloroflexi bacterium]|nr:M23 family metallopeptidase [Chloroflexota bacterium]